MCGRSSRSASCAPSPRLDPVVRSGARPACYAREVPPSPNARAVDRFSIVHAAWGAAFELSGIPAPLAIAAQIAFEVVENPLKRLYSPIFPDDAPDAWPNQVGDVASFAAGFYLSRLFKDAPAGRAAVVALGAMSGAIWLDRLIQRPPSLPGATAAAR